MKGLFLTGAALVGFTCGVFAQDTIGIKVDLDGSQLPYGVAYRVASNYYTGPYGLEVWASAVWATSEMDPEITAINSATNLAAYALLGADGFERVAGLGYLTMSDGTIEAGIVKFARWWPADEGMALALAVWASDDVNWASAVGNGVNAGVLAFFQDRGSFTDPVAPLQWGNTDLVLTPIPPYLDTTDNGTIIYTNP